MKKKRKRNNTKDFIEQKLTSFRSVMFDFTSISFSLLDTVLDELYQKMVEENPFNKHVNESLMKEHIKDIKNIIKTLISKRIIKFIQHDAKDIDEEDRITSFKECLKLQAQKQIDVELIEQEKHKVVHSHVEYDLNRSIKNANKYRKDNEKIVRDKESEEELENLHYGFLLAEKKCFWKLLEKLDEDIKVNILSKYFYKIDHPRFMMIRDYKAIILLGILKLRNDYKNDKEAIKLRPNKWKESIEHNEDNYTQIYSDTKDYKSLFDDNKAQIQIVIEHKVNKTVNGKEVTEEEIKIERKLVSISELKNKFKVFRINNMELFVLFNSVLHFYHSQGRKDLYKLEYVYYRFNKCYAVERIINKSPISLEDVVYLIEGHKSNYTEGYTTNEACILKCLKLTGIEDINKKGVTLISHPAILPLYVFVPIVELVKDIPKEFKMTYFERYMKVESNVNQRGLKITNGKFIKCTDEYLKYCYNGVY